MPKVDESYIKNIMSQLMNTEPEDFSPIDAEISVDAEDGAPVAMLLTGYAKGGKLTGIEATDFEVSEMKRTGLKEKLSAKEKDGDTKEEE